MSVARALARIAGLLFNRRDDVASGSVKPEMPPLLDNPHAPEWFADGAIGFYLRHGVVAITLATARFDHTHTPGLIQQWVVGQLVMPIAGAQGLSVGLFDFLKQRGVEPSPVRGTAIEPVSSDPHRPGEVPASTARSALPASLEHPTNEPAHIHDDPFAPILFADVAFGFFLRSGMVTTTFAASHFDHSHLPSGVGAPPTPQIVVVRLALPVSGARGLAMGLFDFLKQRGFDPAPKPDDQLVQ
jgi:hypothetical protein